MKDQPAKRKSQIGYMVFLHCIANFEDSSSYKKPHVFYFLLFCISFYIGRYHFDNFLELYSTLTSYLPEKRSLSQILL